MQYIYSKHLYTCYPVVKVQN